MKREKIERRLRRAAANRQCLNVYLSGCISYYNMVPLKVGNGLLLAACDADFRIDGCMLIPIQRITAVYRKGDKYDEIMETEKVFDGFEEPDIDMTSAGSALSHFLGSGEFVSVDHGSSFFIGRVSGIKRKSACFTPFDIQGQRQETVKVRFEDIRDITFGDMYTRVFSKYIDRA